MHSHPHRHRPRRSRRQVGLLAATALVAGFVLAPGAATADDAVRAESSPNKIADTLASSFKADATQDFWVKLNVRADNSAARQLDDWNARGTRVAATLRAVAAESQAPVRALLDSRDVDHDSFWITNAIFVRGGDHDLASELSAMSVVERVFPQVKIEQDRPLPGVVQPKVGAVEWGVADVNADDVWAQYGTTGENIVVANIDTGVQYNHPALVDQYRGNLGGGDFDNNYNWFDVLGGNEFPTDGDQHGTHTMGTIVGSDGGANQIGVAPGARWIASNALMGSTTQFLEAMEWMLEPLDLDGENPDASKRPNIISNSWGVSGVPTDPFGDDIHQAWIDSGIFGTWSNRNLGPNCNSTGSPGGRALSYSNGAYDINHVIASFSSRGPGQDGMVKPNISGPGVDVRSSVPGGGYAPFSGTSMSTPHLAGAVALLWSAAPALIGDIEGTRALLDSSAVDQADLSCGGTAEDNNVFGEGRLDVLAAADNAPIGDTGTVDGTVTVEGSGDPVAGATLEFVTEGSTRESTTAADGTYGITLVTGLYDVTVSSFGFEDFTGTVEIEDGEATTFDVELERSESYSLIGRVRDRASGDRLAGVTVSIGGTPLTTVTNDNGGYRFEDVPAGTYQVTAAGGGCYASRTKEAVIDGVWPRSPVFKGDERKRFRLGSKVDAAGYSCRTEAADYVEAGTSVALTGDDAVATVALPFGFAFYGQTYNSVQLSTNGHVRFVPDADAAFTNIAIPSTSIPNAVIAGFWDDMVHDASSSVRTSAGSGTFTIEYRNVSFYQGTERVDFTMTLHDDGEIVVAYRNLDADAGRELGSSATVGVESAAGTVGLQYSLDSAVLSNETAIRFLPPAA